MYCTINASGQRGDASEGPRRPEHIDRNSLRTDLSLLSSNAHARLLPVNLLQ
jgi:hypothetical protein